MSARAYPLPQPESGIDPRFTHGLIYDIRKVLEAAGYPPITNGRDIVELQLALFRFIYEPEAVPTPATDLAETGDRLDEDQPAPPARGHGQDDAPQYAHAMAGPGVETPRCGAVGPVVVFQFSVTCHRCLALLAAEKEA